jgi:hypothetical protein
MASGSMTWMPVKASCSRFGRRNPHPIPDHADLIETGIIVQGQGDIVFGQEMPVVDLFQVNAVIEVAVHHQHRIVVEPIEGLAQTAAGAENLGSRCMSTSGQPGAPLRSVGQGDGC